MKRVTIIGIAIVVILFLGALSFSGVIGGGAEKKIALANCLTENDAIMYGAFWCPNCDTQKKKFGSAFKIINYVECDPRGENAQPQLCELAGITGYPTWIIKGQKITGAQSLNTLAEFSECEY